MVLEASELMEHFQWKKEDEIGEYVKHHKEHIGDEMADVLNYLLLLAHDLKIDIKEASERKLKKNNLKYPVKLSKNKKEKYNKL